MASDAKQAEVEQAAKDATVRAAANAWRSRPKDLPAHARAALWEAMWEAYDFSWNGLADAGWERGDKANEGQRLKRWRAPVGVPGTGPVHGHSSAAWKEATLQDYWRWSIGIGQISPGAPMLSDFALHNAGLLVEDSTGTLWHILHLRSDATHDKDATQPRLQRTTQDGSAEYRESEGGSPSRNPHALVTGQITARLVAAADDPAGGPDTRLRLNGARMPGLGETLRQASAKDTEPNPIRLTAIAAAFDHVDLSGASFASTARFDVARFAGTALFGDASFTGEVWFDGASFTGEAWFGGASFTGEAWFGGASFAGKAWFGGASFENEANFNNTHFMGEAWFSGAHFEGRASFIGAHFEDLVRFGLAHFASTARFTRVIFDAKDGAGPIRFQTAIFEKLADFSGAQLPNQPERIQGAFKTARFLEEARFEIPQLTAFAAFDGTVFKGKLLLAAARTEAEEQARFASVLCATGVAVRTDLETTSAKGYDPIKDHNKLERGANARFSALERGLRELKRAMAEEKDHGQEHRFFRFELQAKRHRPSIPLWEKIASWSYGVLSDYGNSIGRPLSALVLSVLAFWVIYWIWGASLDQSFHGLEKERSALEFSIRNVMQPFGPWTATVKSTLFQLEIVKIVTCGGPPAEACTPTGPGWLSFRLLATLQSVLSLLLAFLFALALRKKFQIS
ncbi:pentapeptide repeat-containing protein [Nisaea nitritireducens]|uniref:pentapeptide repeat-containing protein n=1 Tax=Nisaea nitritireducens TaxID=568392 RepID=UPI001868C65A|nr:pentapeptide repeat-containing protein [Nisaea nitritireducens]